MVAAAAGFAGDAGAAGFEAAGLAPLGCAGDGAAGVAGALTVFFSAPCLGISFAVGVAAAVGCGLLVFAMGSYLF
jgi:hypothetical protein